MTETFSNKHPKGLWYIIAVYMWEYFSFYGMRALLILYLVEHLKLGDTLSYAISGAYITLVYLSPVVGGAIADRLLGYKRAVISGAILMSIGHIILGLGGDNALYIGMAFIVCGYGFFKSNISCLTGQLYKASDPKKDSAFTLLYLGGNLGGIFAPAICGFVAYYYGWHYGFGLAGIGMIFGLLVFLSGSKYIPNILPENLPPKSTSHFMTVMSMFVIVVASYLALEYQFDGYLLAVIALITFIYFLIILIKTDTVSRKSIIVLIPFFIFGIVFWVFDEQLYTSVEVFIQRNVDTHLLGFNIPASVFTSINPLSILFGGLIVAWIWKKLKSVEGDFGRMIKFGCGFIFQLTCFVLFYIAAKQASINGTSSAMLVIIALVFLGISELFIDPIALAEITSIKDKKHTGFLAAAYMLFTGSVAGFIGAKVADLASFNGVSQSMNLVTQAKLFSGLFGNILMILLITSLLWFLVAILIKKVK